MLFWAILLFQYWDQQGGLHIKASPKGLFSLRSGMTLFHLLLCFYDFLLFVIMAQYVIWPKHVLLGFLLVWEDCLLGMYIFSKFINLAGAGFGHGS